VEVACVLITYRSCDISNRQGCVRKQILSLTKTFFDQQFLEGSAGLFFDKPAERLDVLMLYRCEISKRGCPVFRIDVIKQMKQEILLV
jgi:hypothetical protein